MNKIISTINEKGGTGKTTSVLGISFKMKKQGKKILLIDLDYQMNLTTSVLNDISVKTIYDLLMGNADIMECIQEGEVDIIPGDIRMRNLDKNMEDEIFKEVRMKDALDSVSEKYDYTMIDCRPDMKIAETNAIVASNTVIVPIEPHVYSLDGLDLLTSFKNKIEKQLNKKIPLVAFYTRVGRGKNPLKTMKYGNENYNNIMQSYIRNNVKLQEASTEKQSIFEYAPKSNGAKDYSKLVEELKENGII